MFFDVRAAKQFKPGEHLVVEGCEGLRLVASASKMTWTYRYKQPAMKHASKNWPPVAALLLLSLAGCASNTPTMPPVIASRPQPTPLPASVSRIDPQSSQPWLREVESFLSEADLLLNGETTKCSFCLAR